MRQEPPEVMNDLAYRLGIGNRRLTAGRLVHAVEVIQGPGSAAQGLGMSDGGGHISFGEQHRLGQVAAVSQVAS